MIREVTVIAPGTAETTLPHACVTCGGDLQLRVSPGSARTFCGVCHTILRPRVSFNAQGLVLDGGVPVARA
jgi:hypothetical protein